MTADSSKIETDGVPSAPRRKAVRAAKKPRERTGPQADWKHVGGEVPPELYAKLVRAARKDTVPQSAILRWALADYLVSEDES